MDFAKGLRPHPTKQTMLPLPSPAAKVEEAGGAYRLTDTLTRAALATYMTTVGLLMQSRILEAPLSIVMHHPGGFRIRVEQDVGAEGGAERMGAAIAGFADAIAKGTEGAEGGAFEYSLECGCGVRVEFPAVAPAGGTS